MIFATFEQWTSLISKKWNKVHAPTFFRLWMLFILYSFVVPHSFAASSLVFSNTTVGAPSLQMPDLGSTSGSCTTMASNTTKYKGLVFTPGVTGAYTITVNDAISTDPMFDDTIIYVYQTTFNEASVCSNFVVMGNDPPGTTTAVTLTSGTQYIMIVAAAFETEDAFQVTISNDANNAAAFGSSTALPVEITSISANVTQKGTTLNWVMASESNNAGWDVEEQFTTESVEKKWRKVGFVEGAGTSTLSQKYTFDLGKLLAGNHTFRLKQYDLDGSVTFSDPLHIFVEFDKPFSLISAYPNPFNPSTQFEVSVPQAQNVLISVYNILGQKVLDVHRGQMSANTPYRFTFDGSGMASGLYVVQIVGNNFKTNMNLHLLK